METQDLTTKAHILLVEDTLTQALLIQHQLKKAGYTVKLARNAEAALAETRTESFGLILSDINMPGMDGMELCKVLKSSPQTKEIPFILLATPLEKGEILKMLSCGADDFILKSYDEEQFLNKLAEIISCSELQKEADDKRKIRFQGETIEISWSLEQLAAFTISSYEMYLFQVSRAARQVETKSSGGREEAKG